MQLNSTSENPFDWNLIFTAPDGTTRLWWKVSKTNLTRCVAGGTGVSGHCTAEHHAAGVTDSTPGIFFSAS